MRKNGPGTSGRSAGARISVRRLSAKSGSARRGHGPQRIGDQIKPRSVLPPAGVLTSLTVLMLAAPAAAQTRRWEKRFVVAGKPIIILHNPSGRIHVRPSDRNEVLVSAQYSGSRVVIASEQADNRVEVAVHLTGPQGSSPTDLRADFEIVVPTEAELQVRTDSGSVVIESVHGDMSFDTVT